MDVSLESLLHCSACWREINALSDNFQVLQLGTNPFMVIKEAT